MRKYRIVKLTNNNFRVEYFETNWLLNPFRRWDSWQGNGYLSLDLVKDMYNDNIRERDNKYIPIKAETVLETETL
jgi:hypothetical protein